MGAGERWSGTLGADRFAGVAPEDDAIQPLVDEVCGWLRALLRDVLCGHLDSDLRSVADGLLEEEDVAQQTLV